MSKKWYAGVLAVLLAIGLCMPAGTSYGEAKSPSAKSAPDLADAKGHWAEGTIMQFVQQGIISGYEDGSFRPDRQVTRAETISLINKLFGYQDAAEISYKDIKPDDWFYKEVGKAQKAGYISGYEDGTFRATMPVTRQEIAVLIAKLLAFPGSDTADRYVDAAGGPVWSKAAIGSVIDAGIMNGYDDKTIKPFAPITRAEAVTVLQRAVAAKTVTYDQAGVYGPESGVEKLNKHVIINASDVTLRNVEINGDLLLGEGIGEGDVTLDHVIVRGKTIVRGGGENSIHFEDSIMVTVIVDKATGKVRIVASGATQIADVTVQSDAKIEAGEGATIDSVTLSDALPQNSQVQMVGSFESVNVIARSIVVEIPKGSVKSFNVANQAEGTKINVGNEASVISLIVNAAASIVGQGKVQNATINAEGVSMEKAPEKTTLGSDVPADLKLKIGDKEVTADQANRGAAPSGASGVTGSAGGTSGGDSGSGDSGNGEGSSPGNDIPVVPLPVGEIPVLSNVTQKATVGESVYAASSMDGWIYIVESGTTRTVLVLEEAVKAGKGVKQPLTVTEGVYSANVGTTGLSKTRVNFIAVAVSKGNQVSYPSYITLFAGPTDPLAFSYVSYTPQSNKQIALNFNKPIENHLADLNALKAAVTFSSDNDSFQPLSANDTVTIRENRLEIVFAVPYSGANNKVKLAASTVKDGGGNVYAQEVTSNPVKAGAMVTKISAASSFTAGEEITVRTNQPATVYLAPALGYNTLFDIENEVVAKRAVKIIVDENHVNQDVTIPTAGLAPGMYYIQIWAGNMTAVMIK